MCPHNLHNLTFLLRLFSCLTVFSAGSTFVNLPADAVESLAIARARFKCSVDGFSTGAKPVVATI